MFEELFKIGADVRFVSGATQEDNALLIGLQKEMSLKIRTMISLAIPNSISVEFSDNITSKDESSPLDDSCLKECIACFFETLISQKTEMVTILSKEQDSSIPDEVYDKEEKKSDFSVDTRLEDIDFSVRTFNCLKRAGYNTVGEICGMTDEELMKVPGLGMRCVAEIKEKIGVCNAISDMEVPHSQSYTELLEELVGLENVKYQIKRISAFAKMKQDMEIRKKSTSPIVLNMEFTGNPGTAKTTVARILAGVFKEIGILKSGDIIEVGRADLVASYVGQTAEKVKSVFRSAKGKLLFIDEAYSLVENCKGEFGDEAINAIVQEMENNREDTIVIFAGYPDEMKEFFSRNPGLQSRVPFHIEFSDYNAVEMSQIAKLEAQKRGFSMSDKALEKVERICSEIIGKQSMGNGRFSRNLVENAILSYATRAYGENAETQDRSFMLSDLDFTMPKTPRSLVKHRIGFN